VLLWNMLATAIYINFSNSINYRRNSWKKTKFGPSLFKFFKVWKRFMIIISCIEILR